METTRTTTRIESMNAVRTANALQGLTKYNGKIMTKAEFIEALHREGYRPVQDLKPELKYDRRKFNAMTNERGQQDEYYRRCTEKTKPYYKMENDDSLYEISYSEYQHAITL